MFTWQELKRSVVRVDGRLQGTGFFISMDGTILTCFHVVGNRTTGEITDKPLRVMLANGDFVEAYFVGLSPNPQKLDFATIRLITHSSPPDAILFPLGERSGILDTSGFFTFGYRSASDVDGLPSFGFIGTETTINNTGARVLSLHPQPLDVQQIREGMSGAPVFEKTSQQIIGIISTSLEARDGDHKDIVENVPFALPIMDIARASYHVAKRVRDEKILKTLYNDLKANIREPLLEGYYEELHRIVIGLPPFASFESESDKYKAVLTEIGKTGRVAEALILLNKKIGALPLKKAFELRPVALTEFVNRQKDLRSLGNYGARDVFVDAPMGYGKTELLREIQYQRFQEKWLAIYVDTPPAVRSAQDLIKVVTLEADLPNLERLLPSIQDVGSSFARSVSMRADRLELEGCTLLIDSLDRLDLSQIAGFAQFLASVKQDYPNLSLVLAGRNVGLEWKTGVKAAGVPTIEILQLEAFNYDAVLLTIEKQKPNQSQPKLLAAHVMYLTGGHPGAMDALLRIINYSDQTGIENDINVSEMRYRETVLPIAKQILGSIPKHLRDAFDTLSVFRRYNYRLIEKILRECPVSYAGTPEDLIKELTATYLVTMQSDGFIQDDVFRRILVRRMLWEERSRFLASCAVARDIYFEELRHGTLPPAIIAVEALFQELQFDYHSVELTIEERRSLRKSFLGDSSSVSESKLHYCLEILKNKPDSRDCITQFRRLLIDAANWEFEFAVNFYLRDTEYSSDPFDRFLMQVDSYLLGNQE